MGSRWEQVVKDVISEVFETMFFTIVEFEACDTVERLFRYESEINLRNHEGCVSISLRVNEEFARMITANFLGTEEEQVTDDDLSDTVKELANMVGGGFHARMKDGVWQLGIPSVRKIDSKEMEKTQDAERFTFAFFGEPAGAVVLNYLSVGQGQL